MSESDFLRTLFDEESTVADDHLEETPMWHCMGLDGLEGFELPFKPKLADKNVAKKNALLDSCTRMRVKVHQTAENPEGESFEMLSPFGNDIQELTSYPFFRSERKAVAEAAAKRAAAAENAEAGKTTLSPPLEEFRCSVAVSLFLRFNMEFAALMALAFLFSIPHLADNINRNDFRIRCRNALMDDCARPPRSSSPSAHCACPSQHAARPIV